MDRQFDGPPALVAQKLVEGCEGNNNAAATLNIEAAKVFALLALAGAVESVASALNDIDDMLATASNEVDCDE